MWEQHVAAITGMLCEDGALEHWKCIAFLPALPCRWLPFPARSQDFSCCSLLGSRPVGKGSWRQGCPAAAGGDGDGDPSPGTPRRGEQAFNLVRNATFFLFLSR